MPTLTINGQEATAEPGMNLIEAARLVGAVVPHYCYHPALKIVASCRVCLVEVTQEIRGRTRTSVVTACNTPAADGMIVDTESEAAKKARGDIMEFLLINHPVDCPVCDQAGECKLQDYALIHGLPSSRFGETKRFAHAAKLGDGIRHYANRCILCGRCVRFLEDQSGTGELCIAEMGNDNQVKTAPGRPIGNPVSKNIVDLCPVGALLDEDFLFKARAWNLTPVKSISPSDAGGANIFMDIKDNEVQRIRPRRNDAVNGFFISNETRASYKIIRDPLRLENPVTQEGGELVETAWETAIGSVADRLASAGSDAIILVSTHATVEEMEAATRLAESLGSQRVAHIPNAHVGERQELPGGFVIEGDKSPNTAGAIKAIERIIDDIGIDAEATAVLVVNPSVDRMSISEAHLDLIGQAQFVAAIDVLAGSLATRADICLAGRMWAEKSGTFVNSAGTAQPFSAAVRGPEDSRDDAEILDQLADVVRAAQATGAPA
jgi:NADH-quinone oxidoreductase subunit G